MDSRNGIICCHSQRHWVTICLCLSLVTESVKVMSYGHTCILHWAIFYSTWTKETDPSHSGPFLDKHPQQKHSCFSALPLPSMMARPLHKASMWDELPTYNAAVLWAIKKCSFFHLPKSRKTRRPNNLINTQIVKPTIPREDADGRTLSPEQQCTFKISLS